MSWTTPSTVTVGQTATAALWNAQVRDNMSEVWRELAYVERTSSLGITATTEGTATTVIDLGTVTYPGTPCVVEFFFPYATTSAGGIFGDVILYDATAAAVVGRLTQIDGPAGGAGDVPGGLFARRLTPSSGARNYLVKAYTNSGTFTVQAGAGGAGTVLAAFGRVTAKGS